MQVKREAKIYRRSLPSGNTTFRVDMGTVNGKRRTKDYRHEVEALKCKAQWDAEIQQRNLGALQDLAAVNKREILLALERLAPFNASILDVADFYIRYAMPPKGPITVEEAARKFLEAKKRANRRPRYIKAIADSYLSPLQRAFPGRIVSEISTEEMRRFIFGKERAPKTVLNYLKSLDVFFNFLIREGHCTMNPQARIEKPMIGDGKTTFLTVEQAQAMLQFAFDNNRKAECACMTLVLFCGVRVEEVERLTWADVRLETGRVHLEGAVTKKRKRRINEISTNAMEWLMRCSADGEVAPKNYDNRMRAVRREAKVTYSQNAMRHSFASYHVAMHEDAAKTAFMLGHPDANLLYNNYRDLVSIEQAKLFWEIVPAEVVAQREQAKALKAERDAASKRGIRERLNRNGKAPRL
ncbi:MAG: hypothetical protein QOE70_5963 [Chthoniobacter sp.]|jgi:integrase|nr:hypothetical protein [Chthoniobacter sp.]